MRGFATPSSAPLYLKVLAADRRQRIAAGRKRRYIRSPGNPLACFTQSAN